MDIHPDHTGARHALIKRNHRCYTCNKCHTDVFHRRMRQAAKHAGTDYSKICNVTDTTPVRYAQIMQRLSDILSEYDIA